MKAIGIDSHHRAFAVDNTFDVGEFKIKVFEVKHDVPAYGFLIKHEGNLCCFITDTHFVAYRFKGLNNIIIECNYSNEIMEQNIADHTIHNVVRNRVLESHIELQTCKDFLLANDLSHVNNIVLIHLSNGNSNERQFKQEIEALTGKPVHIADKGMSINLDKTPF